MKNSIAYLRSRLLLQNKQKRHCTIPVGTDINHPQSVKSDLVWLSGRQLKRKRIVLLSPGCSVATCNMCPLPNEAIDLSIRQITAQNIINQFDFCFKNDSLDNYQLVTLYNNGNFFSNREVFPEVRKYIYQKIINSSVEILSVESLPQFLTPDSIQEITDYLSPKTIMVSIGLQSADDTIRQLAVNSTCTRDSFENAVKLISSVNGIIQPFLMVKPPFVTEAEAIKDSLKSVLYLSSLGIRDSILCSTRVAPNTVLESVYQAGLYQPPWIWTVVEILKQCHHHSPLSLPRVAISELITTDNADSLCTQNCHHCSSLLVDLISQYNFKHDISLFKNISCDCYQTYLQHMNLEQEKYAKLSIPKRVDHYLNLNNRAGR